MPYKLSQEFRRRVRARYWADPEAARAEGRRKWHLRQERGLVGYNPTRKYKAREAVRVAVKEGKIVKPENCQRCRKRVPRHRLHGHHKDYTKPLKVKWLCSKCHGEITRQEKEVEDDVLTAT